MNPQYVSVGFFPSAWKVLKHRYLRKDQSGAVVETPECRTAAPALRIVCPGVSQPSPVRTGSGDRLGDVGQGCRLCRAVPG